MNLSEQYRPTTLAEHAECWWAEQGHETPLLDTPEHDAMYEAWVRYAFADIESGDTLT